VALEAVLLAGLAHAVKKIEDTINNRKALFFIIIYD
jgi:hypothetical protein